MTDVEYGRETQSNPSCRLGGTGAGMTLESEGVRRVLVREGLVSNQELLEEIKALPGEMKARRGMCR